MHILWGRRGIPSWYFYDLCWMTVNRHPHIVRPCCLTVCECVSGLPEKVRWMSQLAVHPFLRPFSSGQHRRVILKTHTQFTQSVATTIYYQFACVVCWDFWDITVEITGYALSIFDLPELKKMITVYHLGLLNMSRESKESKFYIMEKPWT